ncbi:MAG: cytochrome ubiquinol oxidase subunit I [Actinomycetota bacterium]
MNELLLARWQFGITTVYHFLMVPLTLGLSMMVAWYHTRWHRHGDEADLRLTKFFGKLFLINFAMGVVTGIVQEFQFGMNWSDYSRFVGDVFGAPLAMEGLVAFFLESTFLGLWIFGWGRLPPRIHHATIWCAAIGTWLSAYFIVAANSWMQHPVGAEFNPETGRAELTDIFAVLTNVTTLAAYPHIIAGSLMTAGMFVAGISAWSLIRNNPSPIDVRAFKRAMRGGLWLVLFAGLAVIISGDQQAKILFEQQPMKMASAEALCNTTTGAPFSVFAVGDVASDCDVWSIDVPDLLSYLATGDFNGTVDGVNDLQAEYEQLFGPGDYIPNLVVTYWGFRAMMGFGFLAMGVAAVSLFLTRGGRDLPKKRWIARTSIAMIVAPFLANVTGWVFTEMGRQPWVVAPNLDGDLDIRLLTADAVSPGVAGGEVLLTLTTFTLVYGALGVVELFLLRKYVKAGPDAAMTPFPRPPDGNDDSGQRDDDPDDDGTDRDDHERIDDDEDADRLVFAY